VAGGVPGSSGTPVIPIPAFVVPALAVASNINADLMSL
jgi:hypothetical protein